MAGTQLRDLDLVRDMYIGRNPGTMTERQRAAHIDETLRNNPDVLFKVYQRVTHPTPGWRLHMVFLNPTDPSVWMREIQERITSQLSFQMSRKRDRTIFKITMSGQEDDLQLFCNDFHELHDRVMRNMRDEGAAAARDDDDGGGGGGDDDVEELRARIQDLELENRRLRETSSDQDGS